MVGCWVGCVGPLSSCFDEATALLEGIFYPWGMVYRVGGVMGENLSVE